MTEKESKLVSLTEKYKKPMVFDVFSIGMLIAFGIAVFFNITFITSPDQTLRLKALVNLSIATLFVFGIALKSFTDKLQVIQVIDEKEIPRGNLTSSEVNLFGKSALIRLVLGIIANLSLNLLISIFLIAVPLSIYELSTENITFAIISSVSEEMFFLSLQDVIFNVFSFAAIPISVGTFGLYHSFVYATNPGAIIFVMLGRLVYSVVYLYTRSISASFLGHLGNNLIALIKI